MSQIARKFIADNAVNGAKIQLDNAEMLRWRNAANSADVNVIRVTSGDKAEFQVLPEALASLPVPSSPKQLATVEYVENMVIGKADAKDAVQLLRDTNLALTGSLPLVIDGSTLANATPLTRIGLVAQTTGSQNGIYTYSDNGSTYTLTRSADFDQNSEVTNGAYFLVTGGTAYSGYEVLLTTADPIVVGATSLTFVKYPSTLSLTAGDMLTKAGNDFSVDLASNGGLESTSPGNAAGQLRAKTRTGDAEKDQTLKIDATGNLVAKKFKRAQFTLAAADITNQYVDLSDVAADGSVNLAVAGAGTQVETVDFTINYTGGAGSKTRATFGGGLATAGVSALAAGDVLQLRYGAY